MNKSFIFVGLISVATLFVGCVANSSAPVSGSYVTSVRAPFAVTENSGAYSKAGTSTALSVLGLVATGDASIETAAKNGNIKKIHHVDYHASNAVGIYASYTVIVYGE